MLLSISIKDANFGDSVWLPKFRITPPYIQPSCLLDRNQHQHGLPITLAESLQTYGSGLFHPGYLTLTVVHPLFHSVGML